MKILFFNIFQGKYLSGLLDYILEQKKDVDVFCFTETFSDLSEKIETVLGDFKHIYTDGVSYIPDNRYPAVEKKYAQSIFVGKDVEILRKSNLYLFKQTKDDVGFMQFALLRKDGLLFWVGNTHGKALPGHKKDTPLRVNQSKRIIKLFSKMSEPVIIGGDFNLLPDTRSIKLFENNGYRDLISEYGITDTRGEINKERYEDEEIQTYADYVFVKGKVDVNDFLVPRVRISDHLPLIIDFGL